MLCHSAKPARPPVSCPLKVFGTNPNYPTSLCCSSSKGIHVACPTWIVPLTQLLLFVVSRPGVPCCLATLCCPVPLDVDSGLPYCPANLDCPAHSDVDFRFLKPRCVSPSLLCKETTQFHGTLTFPNGAPMCDTPYVFRHRPLVTTGVY